MRLVLINNNFLKHKQVNIKVNSRRFGVVVTPFSRQSKKTYEALFSLIKISHSFTAKGFPHWRVKSSVMSAPTAVKDGAY